MFWPHDLRHGKASPFRERIGYVTDAFEGKLIDVAAHHGDASQGFSGPMSVERGEPPQCDGGHMAAAGSQGVGLNAAFVGDVAAGVTEDSRVGPTVRGSPRWRG